MRSVVLTANAGSSSLKVGLVQWPLARFVGTIEIDQIGSGAELIVQLPGQRPGRSPIAIPTVSAAARFIARWLTKSGLSPSSVRGIAHRVVVADGYHQPVRITSAVARAIARATARAPLHNPAALAVIRVFRRVYRRATHVAAFDTAFFAHLPLRARTYAIDHRLAARFGLVRTGFHGLSHAAASRFAAAQLGRPISSLRLITVHLGAGCSVTAVNRGRAVDTSMGFTPLEGLVMATRPGDLDSGVVLHLLKQGMTVRQLEALLYHQSGWRGLSGVSDDLRVVLAGAGIPVRGWQSKRRFSAAARRRCRTALAVFIYRIQKYLGAYAAILGTVDAIVFTGAIGERNPDVRRRIVRGLRLPGQPRVVVAPTDEQFTLIRMARRLMS
ncbi:MAG: acetate kinase [Candidatus Kerfeldbacteria bacterium]|nr:acetate kinase [Candidatus Kerfeldbacteria bacterium]